MDEEFFDDMDPSSLADDRRSLRQYSRRVVKRVRHGRWQDLDH